MRSFTFLSPRRIASAVFVLALVLLAAGCGNSPTAPVVPEPPAPPPPPPAPQTIAVMVTFQSILAVADGDGIEGAGDFWFRMSAALGNYDYYYETSRTNYVRLNTGETLTLNKTTTFFVYDTNPLPLRFTLAATEVDQDILGNVFADSDLNDVVKTVDVPWDDRHYNVGLIKTRLGNSNCMVEFRLTVTSWVLE